MIAVKWRDDDYSYFELYLAYQLNNATTVRLCVPPVAANHGCYRKQTESQHDHLFRVLSIERIEYKLKNNPITHTRSTPPTPVAAAAHSPSESLVIVCEMLERWSSWNQRLAANPRTTGMHAARKQRQIFRHRLCIATRNPVHKVGKLLAIKKTPNYLKQGEYALLTNC
uniref:Uncharacterized protein n=1 Tax=Pristionchus pacificus TaxID=54126 RepID=A0A2A6CDT8_PRIPA|eukprot:PDM76405.1 hypothetical protein PRIPAC_40009 [Pristionchus pacificus]